MAQPNKTPIQLYYSTTLGAAPSNANLLEGELAINIRDGKLYYKDESGVVQVIATKGAGTIGGSTTQIQYNNAGALAGSADMTYTSATNTVLLTKLNLTNALGTIYGGTGLTSYTTGDLLYSSASNTLAKLAIGTANYILTVNSGGTNVQWSAPSSISVSTATNLAGGVAGSVPYQSGASTTVFLGIGAADRVMTSSGSAPQWVTALTGLTGVSSSSITNTSLTSGRVVYSGTGGLQTNSANLTFDGTTLTTAGLSNSGTSGLVKLVTVGGTSFLGTTPFVPATPAKFYLGTGTVTDNSTGAGGTQTYGAIMSLGITPIAATLANVTYTNAATLYIEGAPSAVATLQITNPYSLYVAAGKSYFGANVGINTTSTVQGLNVGGGLGILNSATLPVSIGNMTLSFENPVNRIYMGDGTGYSFALSKRASSTTTDLVTLTDGGNLSVGLTSTQNARFSVYGGALASGSSGLAISAALTAGRLTSGDTNSATAYIGNFLDNSITELSAGSSGVYTSGIVAFGGTAAVNPNTVKTYTAGTVRTTVDSTGLTVAGYAYIAQSTGAGVVQVGTASGRTQYQYVTFGGATGGTDYGWQVGRSPTAGIVADGFYIYDIKANTTRMAITLDGYVGIGTSTPAYLLTVLGSSNAANNVLTGSQVVVGTTLGLRERGNTNGISGTVYPTQIYQGNNGGGHLEIYNVSPTYGIVFGTQTLERGRFEANGNFVVGSTTALKFNTSGSASARLLTLYSTGTNSGTRSEFQIGNAATGAGEITGLIMFGCGASTTTSNQTAIIYSSITASSTTTATGNLIFGTANGSGTIERGNFAANGLFTATYGSYADPSLVSSGGAGLQIQTSATYNDNSGHSFSGYASSNGVVYVRATGVSAIPFYSNGGGGVAYQWTVLNPQTGAWSTGAGPTVNFTENSASPNSYSVVWNGGGGNFTITRTGGTTPYTVHVQLFGTP